MEVTRTFAATRDMYQGSVGLIPTMGFFHEGHLKLMELMRDRCDTLVVSLFVNPTQFNDPNDFDRYPRSEERDSALAREAGVDIVFAPDVDEVYGGVSITTVEVTGVTQRGSVATYLGVILVVVVLLPGSAVVAAAAGPFEVIVYGRDEIAASAE